MTRNVLEIAFSSSCRGILASGAFQEDNLLETPPVDSDSFLRPRLNAILRFAVKLQNLGSRLQANKDLWLILKLEIRVQNHNKVEGEMPDLSSGFTDQIRA